MKKKKIILNVLIILLVIFIIAGGIFKAEIKTTISATSTSSEADNLQEGDQGEGQGDSQSGGQGEGQGDLQEGGQGEGQGDSQEGTEGEGQSDTENDETEEDYAATSEYDYNHLDIRVNISYTIEDEEYSAEDVSIVVVTQSGGEIILMADETTADENNSDDIEEYKSQTGHSEGESLQLMQGDIIYVTLSFTYYDGSEYVTTSVSLEYELLEENNECTGGSLGQETYGYDITINIVDYVEVAESERTYNYTVQYVDINTGEEINDEKTGEDATVNTQISASDEIIDIDGYTYIKTSTDLLTISSNEDENVIIIYYAKNTSVVVYYLDYTTKEEIADYETIEGYEGLSYETEQKEIDGYYFVESTDNTSGEMESDIIYVYYYYTAETTDDEVATVTEDGETSLPSTGGWGDAIFTSIGFIFIIIGIMITRANKNNVKVSSNKINSLKKSVYDARKIIDNWDKK